MSMNLSLFKISSISKFPSLIPTPDHLSFEAAAKVQFLISNKQTIYLKTFCCLMCENALLLRDYKGKATSFKNKPSTE